MVPDLRRARCARRAGPALGAAALCTADVCACHRGILFPGQPGRGAGGLHECAPITYRTVEVTRSGGVPAHAPAAGAAAWPPAPRPCAVAAAECARSRAAPESDIRDLERALAGARRAASRH